MNRLHRRECSPTVKAVSLALCALLILSACAREVVQIKPPYDKKVRVGDGIKATTTDGTIHSGRVVYVDRNAVVIRTPRQTLEEHPVKASKFGTTIPWKDVRWIKIAGTLDSQGKLISNEEIRVNRRTKKNRNLLINVGLLGVAASFATAVYVQDRISPASADLSRHNHGKARIAFWSTWVGGAVASAVLGYRLGDHLDRRRAIARIERLRAELRDALTEAALAPVDSSGAAKGGP